MRIVLCTLFALLLATPAVCLDGQQFVANPSFDTDLTYWVQQWNPNVTFTWTNEQTHSGTGAAKIVVASAGEVWQQQVRQEGIVLSVGQKYAIGVWILALNSVKVTLEFSDHVGGQWVQDAGAAMSVPADGQWHLVSVDPFTASAGAKALRIEFNAAGTFYVDDATIVPSTTPVQPTSWGGVKSLYR